MNNFNIAVGKHIRQLREDYGYTREKLSELAGINDKFLYEVETGRKGISAHKMYNISQALGVTMDFLVTLEYQNKKSQKILSYLSGFREDEIEKIEEIVRSILSLIK